MRIYDVGSGRLLFQSDGFAPMGLHLTPEQVRANRADLQPFDVSTRYGRVRISNSAIRDRRGREYLVQVGEMRQFSAALAHELRTPLAALRGETELSLRRSGRDANERATLASQIEELDRLARLIDQILTLGRAESGQIRLSFAPVDVGELAASLVEQLEPVAQARTVDLRCERNGTVLVNGDAGWLQRLLLNLLDNAMKFTREGGKVVLRVSREAGRARIDVHDTGIGMSAEVTPHVFERFFQADPARSSVDDGAGVGLSLVKWIVDRHEGTIAVRSRVGEGSTFTVRLP